MGGAGEVGVQGLQQICRIDCSFSESAEMRPKTMQVWIVMFLAALCQVAELRLLQGGTGADPAPNHTDFSSNFTLDFESFKTRYGKRYSSMAEQSYRRLIYQNNLRELNIHNSDPARTYHMKPNAFMDVNKDEFRSVYTTVRPPDDFSKNVSCQLLGHTDGDQGSGDGTKVSNDAGAGSGGGSGSQAGDNSSRSQLSTGGNGSRSLQGLFGNDNFTNLSSTISIPPSRYVNTAAASGLNDSNLPAGKVAIDWSAYAGGVRYQGYCGACYAFATVDTLSMHLSIYRYGFFMQLSVQQVIDCSENGMTFGCNGGYLQGALTEIQVHGIVSESTYPFSSGTSGRAGACRMVGGSFKVSSFQPLPEGDCKSVIAELYRGPISAGISAYNLRFYDSGVFNECNPREQLDHAIVITGYESGRGWRIKNSWGVDWGEGGYGWIAQGNTCWICNMTVAVVIDP